MLTNQNFTNMIGTGMLSGYKLDQEGIGLSGWTINAYYQNGTFFGSNVTNSSGYFSFSPVTFGNYTLNETVQSGWELFTPATGFLWGNVTVGSVNVTNLNFTNRDLLGNISGYKWNDLNGNGMLDPGEPGVPGWTIGLDNSTVPYYAINITDQNGNFSFKNVPAGYYTLNETMEPCWRNTTPLSTRYLQPSAIPLSPPAGFARSHG